MAIFEIAKNGIWPKKIREIDLFDFRNFIGLDFFQFSGLLCKGRAMQDEYEGIKQVVEFLQKKTALVFSYITFYITT